MYLFWIQNMSELNACNRYVSNFYLFSIYLNFIEKVLDSDKQNPYCLKVRLVAEKYINSFSLIRLLCS